jgi:hypothetical protein
VVIALVAESTNKTQLWSNGLEKLRGGLKRRLQRLIKGVEISEIVFFLVKI